MRGYDVATKPNGQLGDFEVYKFIQTPNNEWAIRNFDDSQAFTDQLNSTSTPAKSLTYSK